MKKLLLLCAVACGVSGAVRAQTPKLSGNRLSGAGVCQVHYDATGRVDKATVTRSTGSSLLDAEVVKSARSDWRGLPNSTATVPIKYTNTPVLATTGAPLHYQTPLPPYPYEAQFHGVQGSGIVQVIFDLQGKPVYAGMVKGSGSKVLDDNTVAFAQAHWKSSGGEESTMTLPVEYRLVRAKPQGAVSLHGVTGSNIHRPNTDAGVQAVVSL